MFDPAVACWRPLSGELLLERKYCSAATLSGRLLLLGGMAESRSRLDSVEALDPREGRWSSLPPMRVCACVCVCMAHWSEKVWLGGGYTYGTMGWARSKMAKGGEVL